MAAIVFDLYQRYHFIERVITILCSHPSDRILEVGAIGSPLRDLLPGRNLIQLDPDTEAKGLDLRASGLTLPFRDREFEFVVSTDVLEHLSASDRGKFIAELQRVTSGALILGFPHLDEKNVDADRIFNEFVKAYTGQDVRFLEEHLHHGLPQIEEIKEQLKASMPHILEFQNSNVHSWLLLQLGNFVLLQRPELNSVRDLMNDFFNQSLEPKSHGPPCYRTLLLCFRNPVADELNEKLKEAGKPLEESVTEYAAKLLAIVDASETAIQLVTKEKAELESTAKELQSTIHDLEQQLRVQSRQIIDQNRHILDLQSSLRDQTSAKQNLQEYLNLFLNHPVYKFYKAFKKPIHRVIGNGGSSKSDSPYALFQAANEPNDQEFEAQIKQSRKWKSRPLLNIVTSVCDVRPEIFKETIRSVLGQTYDHWNWTVVDASSNTACWDVLLTLSKSDQRIKPHSLPQNGGISRNINEALHLATGDFIVFLDHDDVLARNALFCVAGAILKNPDLDFLYSDSDKLDALGQRCDPFFKPDWSPEMLLCCNILSHLSVFRRSLLNDVGYLNPELDGAQDWDLFLRIAEKTDRIHHIPKILYHWRKTDHSTASSTINKKYAQSAQSSSIASHLRRAGLSNPVVNFDPGHPIHHMYPMSSWGLNHNWKVSVIIPTRDQSGLLKNCLNSVFVGTAYSNYEVILVDTGSNEDETLEYYKELKKNPRVLIVPFQGSFNFGKACNAGAANATGDMLLFLNNDTEILDPSWLERMLQWFERPNVGIVGAKLLYPGGKIQHAGVILGFGGLAAHLYQNNEENSHGIFGSDAWYRNLSAVTGACLMIPKELFVRVNGFDESFQLNYSDVELCLRVRGLGYRIVYTPQARLLHVESATHGKQIPRIDFENATLKWKPILEQGDPYFNPNLTLTSACPALKLNVSESAIQLNRDFMSRLPDKEIITLPDDLIHPSTEQHLPRESKIVR